MRLLELKASEAIHLEYGDIKSFTTRFDYIRG